MCVCVHPFKTSICGWGGFSHTHIQERKCQMFHFLCVWVCLCSWGKTQCRPADSRGVWLSRIHMKYWCVLSFAKVLCLQPFQTNTVPPPTQKKLHTPTYRLSAPLTSKTNENPSESSPSPLPIEKVSTSPSSSFFVFTTLPPSSVALLLRCGWLLWSGPAL